MPKLYFIIGSLGQGKQQVFVDILNYYRDQGKTASLRFIGKNASIGSIGTANPTDTLNKIADCLIMDSECDVVVFTGWKLIDHIDEVYTTYGSTATFIFSHFTPGGENAEKIKFAHQFVTADEASNFYTLQQDAIDTFIQNRNIELTWVAVQDPVVSVTGQINTCTTSTHELALLGTF
jgi:hypothetical protein